MKWLAAFVVLSACLGTASAQRPSPERMAATERHYQATLEQLGLNALRPGANGQDPRAPNAVNYEESRVVAISLPPLLSGKRGKILTAAAWQRQRRPELLQTFETEMYGRVPTTAPVIRWDLAATEKRDLNGIRAETRRYVGRPAKARTGDPSLTIDFSVTLPASSRSRVPVILELGFPEGFRFPGAPTPSGPSWREQVLRRGWGFATIVPSTVQPDDGAGLAEGVIGLASHGRLRANDAWGALRAWGWGASRALDLLRTDPGVDSRKVAIAGLSRYGKAALVGMAFDERFAIGLIGSSGAGGAKLLRRDFGERLENLAASGEYHWFAPNFLRYAGPRTVADLPVDAHSLVALAAPRPLFIGAGRFDRDNWVDPRGSFEAARAAAAVYRLYGLRGVDGAYPAINECRCSGQIAFRQHDGGHDNGPNWPAFLDFAERHWGQVRPRLRP